MRRYDLQSGLWMSVLTLALIGLFFAGQASADSHTDPDFNDDGTVNLADYDLFVSHWGTREGGDNWDAKFDLDGDGVIALGDYSIFVSNWGKTFPVSPSGGGSTTTVDIPDANLRAVIADSLGKASGASITRAEMASLTRLDAPNKGIRSLTGLEHATNLQWLNLGSAWVSGRGYVNSNELR